MQPSDNGAEIGSTETQPDDVAKIIELARASERDSSAQQRELTAD